MRHSILRSALARLALATCHALALAACSGSDGGAPRSPVLPAPRLSLGDGSVAEGHAGTVALTFTATLDAAASSEVTAQYATSDGTARAGSDYVAATGTLVIPAGARSAAIAVAVMGDTVAEGGETFTVTLSNPSSNAALGRAVATGTILDDDAPPPGLGLNDTGVTTCATASAAGLACNSGSAGTDQFPEQDAERGRDATHADDADGHAGFSFVKRGASGAPLADQSAPYAVAPWDCLEDRVTGLFWEVRPNDGGLRDRDWRYTWYDSTGAATGRGRGRPNGGTCSDAASCDTEKYAAAVNAAGLCGFSDWRLPTRSELLSLLDYGAPAAPLLDAAFLPDGVAAPYWSSSRDPFRGPWSVDFSDGKSLAQGPLEARPVRLVRGG